MGSKNNPGKFDCYANAEPDEPMFILLARDALAPSLTNIWAMIRAGNLAEANLAFRELLLSPAAGFYVLHPEDSGKVEEAIECAANMAQWRKENR